MNPEAGPRDRLVELAARSVDRVTRAGARGNEIDPSSVARILVIKPCCLGDLLMATPALRALKKSFPSASIHVMTTEWCDPALARNPNVTATFRYPDRMTVARYLVLARRLKERRYDIGIALDRSPLVNGLLRLAGIPIRAGINSAGRGIGLTHRVPPNPEMHESELYLSVVGTVGAKADTLVPEFHPSESARAHARELIAGSSPPRVVIHPGGAVNPGARMLSKRWPAIMFGELASNLIHQYQADIYVIGADSDRDAVQTTVDFTDGPVANLSRRLSLDETGALCEYADLYIGNDSGMSHLAAAVGTPTITIFGPTDPNLYRPLGPRSIVCAPDGPAHARRPRDLRGAHLSDSPDVDISTVSVEAVMQACADILGPPRDGQNR
ncbi:MAG TPA: glycosyltransferase family 9 protein [Nitrolancea sp.]|nr:glycosyltransferase family 9 protein [Nitrolancea sp.]